MIAALPARWLLTVVFTAARAGSAAAAARPRGRGGRSSGRVLPGDVSLPRGMAAGTAGLRTLVNEAFDQLDAGLPNPSATVTE